MQALPAFTLCLYPLESEILVRWNCLIIQLEATRPSSQSWRGGAQLQSSTWEGEAGGQEAYDQLGTYEFKASVAYIRPQIKKRKRKAKAKQTNKTRKQYQVLLHTIYEKLSYHVCSHWYLIIVTFELKRKKKPMPYVITHIRVLRFHMCC